MAQQLTTLGWEVIDWIEQYLCHGVGDVQGQPIILDDEFAGFILKAYAVHPKGHEREGRRVYNRAFLSRPKGRAKSELAAFLAVTEALGPVRFDGFNADGEPVGRPVKSPEILCVATEESQAGNTYDNISYILSEGPIASEHAVDIGRGWQTSTRILLPDGGTIEPITSSASAKDGGKSTFVVCDETHIWNTPRLRELHSVIRRNLGKRKLAEPWMLETSTMYRPGEDSVAEATHHNFEANPERSLLFDHKQSSLSLEEIGDDDKLLKECLREAYGNASWMDWDRLVDEIRDPQSDLGDSERYFLNRVVVSTDAWIDARDVEQQMVSRKIRSKEQICIGFDGSAGRSGPALADTTVMRAVTINEPHIFTLGWWNDDGTDRDYEVPRGEVQEALERAFEEFEVIRFYADPPYWRSELVEWAETYGDDRIISWATNRDAQMAAALERLQTSIINQEVSLEPDNDVLAHYGNARRKQKRTRDLDKQLTLVKKDTPKSVNKIDCVVADALAFEARADAISAGVRKKKYRVMSY